MIKFLWNKKHIKKFKLSDQEETVFLNGPWCPPGTERPADPY